MKSFSMTIEVIDGSASQASRIKLSRSIFTKGSRRSSSKPSSSPKRTRLRIAPQRSIGDSMDRESVPIDRLRYISGDLIHAGRDAHEFEDIIDFMTKTDVKSFVAGGALERLNNSTRFSAAERLDGEMPESFSEIFALRQDASAI